MTNLRQDTYAVAHLAGSIFTRAVLQLLYDMQRIIQNLVILVSVDVDDGADTAGIVFSSKTLV